MIITLLKICIIVISNKIMQLHHGKHHAAYVTNFNLLLPQYQEAEAKVNERDVCLQHNIYIYIYICNIIYNREM